MSERRRECPGTPLNAPGQNEPIAPRRARNRVWTNEATAVLAQLLGFGVFRGGARLRERSHRVRIVAARRRKTNPLRWGEDDRMSSRSMDGDIQNTSPVEVSCATRIFWRRSILNVPVGPNEPMCAGQAGEV